MKRIRLFWLMLMLLVSSAFTPAMAQETVTVNDGTDTNDFVPVYGYYVDNFSDCQFIIPEASLGDLADGGTISKLTFYVKSSPAWGNAQFEVYIEEVETSVTTFSSTTPVWGGTKVYGPGSLTFSNNQMAVNFTTPFEYSGGKNLKIGIRQTTKGSYVSTQFYGKNTSANNAIGGYGTTSTNASYMGYKQFLPKTTFTYEAASTSGIRKPKNLATSNVQTNSATISWGAVSGVDGYELSWSTTPNAPDNGTIVTGITNTSYNLTGLTAGTTYYVYVRAKKDAEYSDWSSVLEFAPATLILNESAASTTQNAPFYGGQVGSYYSFSQFLIPKASLTNIKGTDIGKLVFYCQDANVSWGDAQFDVYLEESSSNYSSTTTTSSNSSNSLVYSGPLAVVNGKMEIQFSKPFAYAGSSYNYLRVEVRQKTKGTNGTANWYYATSGDLTNNCLYKTGQSSNSITSGCTKMTFYPKMSFVYNPIAAPKSVTLSSIVNTGATVTWTSGGTESEWELSYSTTKGDPDNGTKVTGLTSRTHTLTGLTPGTTYYVYARAKKNGEYSLWSAVLEFAPATLTLNDNITATGQNVPFDGSNLYSYFYFSQFILPYASLSNMAGGDISKLTFYSSESNVSWGNATYDVYLEETSNTNYSSTSANSNSSMTKVYSGGVAIVNGKMEIELSNPFHYTGGSNKNLRVEVRQTNKGTNGVVTWYCASSGTNTNNCIYGSHSSSATNTSGSKVTAYPKMTFGFNSIARPKNVTASNITKNGATISWTKVGTETEWELSYGTTPNADNGTKVTGLTSSSYALANLTPGTTYYVYVRAKKNGEYSLWSAVCDFAPSTLTLNGSATSTTTSAPIYGNPGSSNYAFSQFIVPKASLADIKGGSIGKLTFYSSQSDVLWGNATYDVYVEETSSTSYSNGTASSNSSMTKVYSGSLAVVNGKMNVEFLAPFNYSGNNNLRIEFRQKTLGTNGAVNWYYSSSGTSYNCVYSTGTTNVSNTSGTRTTAYPKMTFTFNPVATPKNLVVSSLTNTGATLTWTAGGSETEWELSYTTTKGDPDNGVKVSGLTSNSCTLTSLTAGSSYYAYVRAKKDGDYSMWSPVCEFAPSTLTLNESATSTSSYVPFYADNASSKYSYSQFIIPKALISGLSGDISRLTFYSPTTSLSWGNATYDVYLEETSTSSYSSVQATSNANFTKVYSGSLAIENGKMVVEFSNPFTYNGSNNLRVEVRQKTLGTNGAVTWYWSSAGLSSNNCVYGYSKSTATDVSGTGSPAQLLPKMTIAFNTIVRPKNLAYSELTNKGATLTWTAGKDETEWELSYGTTANADNGTKVTGLSVCTYALSNLEPGTTYYVYVRAKKDGDYSMWSNVCEFTPATVTLNDGTTTTNTYMPFSASNAGNGYNYGQFIIPKSMLADITGKEINKMIFYSQQTDVSWGNAKFDVYLSETSSSTFSDNTLLSNSNFTKVYSNGSLAVVNGKMVVDFTDNFVYTGNNNLIVEFRQIVTGTNGTTNWYFNSSAVSGLNCVYMYSAGNSTATAANGRTNGIPKITFGYEANASEIQQDGFTLQMNEDQDAFVVMHYDGSSTTPTVPSVVNYEEQDYPVTVIAADALKNHTTITEITIPSSITEIKAGAFTGCTGMEYVYFESTTPPTWSDANTGSEFNTPEGTVLMVPAAAVDAYKSAYPAWSSRIFSTKPIIQDGFIYQVNGSEATIIGYGGSVSELTIPATVTYDDQTYPVTAIADGVFAGKTGIGIVNFAAMTPPAWPDGAVGNEFGTTSSTYFFVPTGCDESYRTAYPAWADNILAGKRFVVGDFTYLGDGNNAKIISYTGTATEVIIPATVSDGIKTYTVNEIVNGVFAGQSTVKKAFFMSSNPPTWADGTVGSEFGGTSNTKLYVSSDALASYKARYTAWDAASAIESTDALFNFTFDSETMTATVTSSKESNPKSLIIPATAKNDEDGLTYTVTVIGGSAFIGKSTVTYLQIPSTVTTINNYAFKGCTGLTEVTIPASVTSIAGADAFYMNRQVNVKSVYFEGVNPPTWGDGTEGDDFGQAQGATKIYVPAESLGKYKAAYTAWANYIYGGVVTAEETVTIGKLTYKLYSFSDGRHTATVTANTFSSGEIGTVPSTVEHDGVTYTVTALGNESLRTDALTVNLPETLTDIGESCIGGYNMTTITIPSNVESMGKWAIYNSSLKTICFKSPTPPDYAKYNNNASYNVGLNDLETVYVPVGSADAYKEAFPLWASKIVEGTVPLMATIDHFKFELVPGENGGENTATLIGIDSEIQNDDLVIPNTVTVDGVEYNVRTIGNGENAIFFRNQKVTIPENVTTIASKAFYNCGTTSGIREVVFAGNSQLTTIGESAFEGCNYLNKITIPENVVTIGDAAFKNCFNINDFAIASNKLKTIGAEAFYSAGNLDNFKLILPASLETVGDNAFHNFKTRYVMFKGAVPPTYGTTMTENDYNSEFLSGFEIVVLEDALEAYQNAPTPWGNYWLSKIRALTLAEVPFNGLVYINDVEYVGPYYRGVNVGEVMFYADALPAAGDVRIPKSFVCPDDNETYQVTVLGKVPAGAISIDMSDNNYLTSFLNKDVFRECRHQLKSVNFANCTSLTLDNFSAPADEDDYSVLNTSDEEFGIVGNSDSWTIDEIDVTDSLIYWKSYTDNGLGGHGVWTTTKEEYDDAAIVAVTAEGDTIYDPRRYEEGYWFYRWNYKWYVTNYRIHHFYHNVSEAERNERKSTYQARGFEEYEEWKTGSVALESVDFSGCTSLTHVPGGFLQHNPKLRNVSFKGCTNLSTVGNCIMAYCDSLKVIDFSDCTSLTENSFPIEYVGAASSWLFGDSYIGRPYPWLTGQGVSQNHRMQKVDFSGCTGFTTLPNGLFFCKADTVLFDGCTGLVSMEKDTEFENYNYSNVYGVNVFGNGDEPAYLSFKDCTSLTTIGRAYFQMDQMGNYMKSVDFSGCTNLREFEAYAFNYRTHLESVNLDGCTNLEVIGDTAFAYCQSLSEIDLTVSENLRLIGKRAFYSNAPGMPLEAIDIRGTNLLIDDEAFMFCTTRLVNLRQGVVRLGDRAFSYQHNVEHINLPNTTLKRIGEGFMYASPKLQSLIIPASVDSIGGAFLWGCEGLRNVYLLGKPAALHSLSETGYQKSFGGGSAILAGCQIDDKYNAVHDCTFWVASPYQYCQYVRRGFSGNESYQYDCSDDAISRMGAWEYPTPTDPKIGTIYDTVDGRLYDEKWVWRQLDRRYTLVTELAQSEHAALGVNRRQYNNRYNDWHLDPDTDNVNIIHTPFTVPDKRKLTANKWATICFPFAGQASYQQYLQELFGEDAPSVIIAEYVKAHNNRTYEDGLYHLTFRRVRWNQLRSNYPYVIYSPKDVTIDMLNGQQMTNANWTADISQTWEVDNELGTNVTMIGNYINPMYLRSNVYFLQSYVKDGQSTMRFVKTAEWGTSWVPEYRCYFEVTKGAGSVVTKSAMGCYVPDEPDDEATQIDNVVIEVEDPEQHVIEGIYTLNGVKLGTTDVKDLPRGIYIVNGKKVVIK